MDRPPESLAGVSDVDCAGPQALVTGSTSGIGRAAALALGRLGADAVVHGRDPRAGAEVVEELSRTGVDATFLEADFVDLGAVRGIATAAAKPCVRMTYPSATATVTHSPVMPLRDEQRPPPDARDGAPVVRCDACEAALRAPGRDAIGFLLVDHLTIPLVGCADHLEQFGSVCGFTTEGTADLLTHRPAGGVPCPGCRLAVHDPSHPMIPVDDGVIVVLACSDHRSDIMGRFRTGLRTRQRLTDSLDGA